MRTIDAYEKYNNRIEELKNELKNRNEYEYDIIQLMLELNVKEEQRKIKELA